MKETILNSSIPVPSSITAKSDSWDSITLSWNAVEGASFYQIEVDESKFWDASTANKLTKRGLLPETEHSFRVRAVCGNEVSDAVKERTQKEPEFTEFCAWKECPDNVDEYRKYSFDEKSPRIATSTNNYGNCYCTVIGNTPLPQNKVTSWNIKMLNSKCDNGFGIYIGVATF